jgi:hypothetical protein
MARMSYIIRLVSIAYVAFAIPHAAAQSKPIAKPLVWKTISTSKVHRSPEAIFWFNQEFIVPL